MSKVFDKNKIKQLRETMGLNQSEFAERVGVKSQTVSAWESGPSIPNGAQIAKIMDATGTKADVFFTDGVAE